MVKISTTDVEHVAKLARLGLSGKEIEQFRQELASVLTYVEKLNEVDTSKVRPSGLSIGLSNVYRDDQAVQCAIPTEELLKNAPSREGHHLKVKAVQEEAP